MKSKWMTAFVMCCGAVVGSLVGELCRGVSFLSWLGLSREFGLSLAEPLYLDLLIFKLRFGFSFTLSISTIIFIFIGLFLYRKFA